jgi:2-iminobutanoate/2-iminopropanoate deaminase
LYSQAVRAGDLVFLSGFVGLDPDTKLLAGPNVTDQLRQALRNCDAVLRAAGSGLSQVVQVTVLLTEPTDFDEMNSEYARAFPNDPPARMVAKLGAVLPAVRVSIAMTAVVPAARGGNSPRTSP